MTKRYISRFPLFLMLLFSLPTIGCAQFRSAETKLLLHTISFNGLDRSYYLHLPPNYETKNKHPLVLVLHGGGKGDGETAAKYLGFTALANRYNFIVAYPNGMNGYWNDGRGVTHRGKSDTSIDDVGFILALVNYLVKFQKADSRKVYITGVSNGGMMTLRLGCEISSTLAAIAPVIANIPSNLFDACRPESPLPILLMNGTDDPIVPWEGGYVRFFLNEMGEVVSTDKTVQFWVKHNQCNPVASTVKLPDKDKKDHSTVKITRNINPKTGVEVVLYTIDGGGHTLPGSNIPDRPRILGRKNNDIDGAKVIWEFFQRHSK